MLLFAEPNKTCILCSMFLMAGTSAGTYPTLWLPQNASVEGLCTSTLCHNGNPAVNPTCVSHSHVSTGDNL